MTFNLVVILVVIGIVSLAGHSKLANKVYILFTADASAVYGCLLVQQYILPFDFQRTVDCTTAPLPLSSSSRLKAHPMNLSRLQNYVP